MQVQASRLPHLLRTFPRACRSLLTSRHRRRAGTGFRSYAALRASARTVSVAHIFLSIALRAMRLTATLAAPLLLLALAALRLGAAQPSGAHPENIDFPEPLAQLLELVPAPPPAPLPVLREFPFIFPPHLTCLQG